MANSPVTWSIAVGGAGSTVFESSSPVYIGSKCLEIRGDAGATLTKLTLALDGTNASVYRPLKKYIWAVRLQRSASLAAGVLKFAVQNAANSDQDSSESSVTLSGVSSSAFELATNAWASGVDVAASPKFVIEVTTALTNGESIYIDELVMTEMPQLSAARNDPYGVGFRGDTDFVLDDTFTVQMTNNGEGQLVEILDWGWDVHRLGYKYQVPTDTGGSETIADTNVS